jgi:glycosyltransferase involved in cell wall biosynthesis
VYNGEKIIEDTLASVINQSYKNLQIIVVDDCSTDGSREVIDRMAASDPRILTAYAEENGNVCRASNTAFRLAQGKYLALIGHDDLWKADKLEKQVHFMEKNPEYAVCFTLCDIIDEENQVCNEEEPILYQVFNQKNRSRMEWVETLLFQQNVFCAPSALIRRECIRGGCLYHDGLVQLQDMALWLELLEEWPVYILQERLTRYRHFRKGRSNLSAWSIPTDNRMMHEQCSMQFHYIEALTDEKLCELLRSHFQDPDASTEAELKCERAFLLKELGNMHCVDLFLELFDCEETSNILEQHYHFKLKDFYEFNEKSISYDREPFYQLQNMNEALNQYRNVVEKQQMIIGKQQQLLAGNMMEETR